jgi:hypothetical protein
MRSDDFWLSSICRDEACPRLDVHAVHPVSDVDRTRVDLRPRTQGPPSVLPAVILDHVEMRRCKRFGEVYEAVVHDFGTVTMRSVHRSLAVMVGRGQVVHVIPRFVGIARRYGAYLLPGSPLLRGSMADLDEAINNAWETYPYER